MVHQRRPVKVRKNRWCDCAFAKEIVQKFTADNYPNAAEAIVLELNKQDQLADWSAIEVCGASAYCVSSNFRSGLFFVDVD